MIASSTTVLANLAYLIGAVVLAVVVGLVVWLRHRQPKSVDANMASFRRGLSALAPDTAPTVAARQADAARIRPVPAALTHVKVEPVRVSSDPDPSAEDGDDYEGGQPG